MNSLNTRYWYITKICNVSNHWHNFQAAVQFWAPYQIQSLAKHSFDLCFESGEIRLTTSRMGGPGCEEEKRKGSHGGKKA